MSIKNNALEAELSSQNDLLPTAEGVSFFFEGSPRLIRSSYYAAEVWLQHELNPEDCPAATPAPHSKSHPSTVIRPHRQYCSYKLRERRCSCHGAKKRCGVDVCIILPSKVKGENAELDI